MYSRYIAVFSVRILKMDDAIKLLLTPGAIGVIPTDTIYGLVARANDIKAVERLYKVKYRNKKIGTLIAANADQLYSIGINKEDLVLAEKFWPGPISVVLPVDRSLEYLDQGIGSLAVRIPQDQKLIRLLNHTGPLITTSANLPDEPSSNTIEEAKAYFGNNVDFYIDSGDLSANQPSAIIKIENGKVVIIRENSYLNSLL